MKGKTGKPSAMRGGGMARKGVGMALKGGGMARKGTGSKATPGGKVAKMAMGGSPPITTMPVRPPAPPAAGQVSSQIINAGGKNSMMPPRGRPMDGVSSIDGSRPGMTRPGFPSRPGVKKPGMSGGKGGPSAGTIPQRMDSRELQTLASLGNTPGNVTAADLAGRPPKLATPPSNYDPGYKKDGGKVSKYAKGGAVKMTAGAGSGSGRLEKVAAHKGAKRVPAANLKSGGKVKGK